MSDKFVNAKNPQCLGWLLAINFNLAAMMLIASLVSVAGNSLVFDNSDWYGPLAGNLRLMMVYLTLSQFAAYCFCRYSEDYQALLPLGLFWLLSIGAIEIYGTVNQIPIDKNYGYFFLYLGLSNLILGGMTMVGNRQQ